MRIAVTGASGFIGGAVARTFANLTSGTFPSYITHASWQLSVKEKQLLPIPKISDAVCHHCRLS